jgi:hypothetical protein
VPSTSPFALLEVQLKLPHTIFSKEPKKQQHLTFFFCFFCMSLAHHPKTCQKHVPTTGSLSHGAKTFGDSTVARLPEMCRGQANTNVVLISVVVDKRGGPHPIPREE